MNKDYVWYACYGSNLSEDRFNIYINKIEKDLNCKISIHDSKPYSFSHPIYFALRSRQWENKGFAFLDHNTEGFAYGWAYLIDREVLKYLLIHENGGSLDGEYEICDLKDQIDSYPVYTISSIDKKPINEVGDDYCSIIAYGINNRYSLSLNDIHKYLVGCGMNDSTKIDISEQNINKIIKRIDLMSK